MDMSKAFIPYHILQRCGKTLLAVRGSSIDLISLVDGSVKSTWKCPVVQSSISKDLTTEGKNGEPDPSSDGISGPPAKKQKLSGPEEDKPESTKGQSKKQKKANRRAPPVDRNEAPKFIALQTTRDEKHLVGVTGEDKCIRVFKWQIDDTGREELQQISARLMPKRPCAIAVTKDDSTILSADKFGDVWSLPLLPSEEVEASPESQNTEPSSAPSKKPIVPAANELTVHSARNRKALEHQKRQTNQAPEKQEPTFEKRLLLGHVSMLTDIALTSFNGRDYIITSDRDEHIRVSRGVPQAYVVEKYLLRHTEFVTQLCIPKERPNILLSGGGDEMLMSWDLTSVSEDPEPLSRLNVNEIADIPLIQKKFDKRSDGDFNPPKFVISGIYHFRMPPTSGLPQDLIMVICEGVVSVLLFKLTAEDKLTGVQQVPMPANPLAIANITTGETQQDVCFLVSLDHVHFPGTTQRLRDHSDVDCSNASFVKVILEAGLVSRDASLKLVASEVSADKEAPMENLSTFLYPLENLRKREVKEKAEGEDGSRLDD